MRQGGFGTVFKIKISSTMTAVAHCQEIGFPEFEKILADITGHDAPQGYEEMIDTGKRKMNELDLKLTWDIEEATHAAMKAAFESIDPVEMSVEDPEGQEVIPFMAHVRTMGRVAEQEEGYVAEVKIKPTGAPLAGS